MAGERLRVGVIGLGAMGTNHLRVLASIPDVQIAAVADAKGGLAAARQADYRIPESYADHRQLLDKAQLDAVIVAVPPELHRPVATDCFEHGVPVLLEKPIAHSLDDAAAIVAAAERTGAACLVGHIERFNPVVRKAREFIASGQVGTPYLCNTRRNGPFPSRLLHTHVGVLVDLAVHDVDIVQYLTGTTITEVQAMFIRTTHREIFGKVLFRGRADVAGSMEFSWISPQKIREIQLFGALGLIEGDYISQTLKFFENPDEQVILDPWASTHLSAGRIASGRIIEYPIWRQEPLRLELEHFIQVVRGAAQPEVTPRQAMQVLEVVLRIADKGLNSKTTITTRA
ncbi:MAG: gfo/Idh/MocA family oxidoreductase [Myxococcales bacterium]|nr:MAG: gfo/Idh/MocA family oxidoreductase [Myxococcales bacterium]